MLPLLITFLNHQMKVADILASADGESDSEDSAFMVTTSRGKDLCRTVDCTSPRLIISRCLSLLKRSKREKEKEKVPNRTAVVERSENRSDAGGALSASSVPVPGVSGQYRKEMSFNLGVGFGLFFLTAASKHELDQMKELQTQMEVILQDIKEELQRRDRIPKSFDSNDSPAFSSANSQEALNVNIDHSLQNYTPSYILPDSDITIMSDQSSRCPRQEEFVDGMDQLAAELEAELDLLQLHLDQEHSQKYSQHQIAEISVGDVAPEGSFILEFGEIVDPQETGTGDTHGITPNELERRLHELHEARQQERINELEAALECAQHKLREKELEVSWWKDAAKLFLRSL